MNDALVSGSSRAAARRRSLPSPWWWSATSLGGWVLGMSTIVILGLSGGGYDAIVRGEAGIAAWWLVGAGVATGALLLPRDRVAVAGLVGFTLIVAWVAVGLSWTESTERTVAEVSRDVGYLGMLLLALLVCSRAPARTILGGVAAGIAVIAGYALLTRLEPQWFPAYALDEVFPTARRRLAQPLGYWNLLAGMMAIGIPLLLSVATGARRVAVRALAGAAVPVLAVVVFLTVSRGGVAAVGIGLVVWAVLSGDRPIKLPVLAAVAAGSAVLCAAAEQRDALRGGLGNAAAQSQGHSMMIVVVLAMLGVAALVAAAALVDRHVERPAILQMSRRSAARTTGVALIVAAIGFVAVGGPGWLGDRFDDFKGQAAASNYDNSLSRFSSVSSNGRWQYWQVLRGEQRSRPFTGSGPGTFEYVWARNDPLKGSGFVRDGHSLWAEALGETGLPGVILVVAFFALALAAGATRALRSIDEEHRAALAGATAGLAAFCAIASVEWAWEMTVVGACGVLLAAVCLAGRAGEPIAARRATVSRPRHLERVAAGVIALVAVAIIAVPTATTAAVRSSQHAARGGDLDAAAYDARTASHTEPYSATALMQQALVLERAGHIAAARSLARRATVEEATNWRTWLILSRLDARAGDAESALGAYRRARALNIQSAMFQP